jgi:hypothetical protein
MVDFKMNLETGEPVISASGDLELVWGDEQIIQEVVFRLRTQKGDWVLSPNVGCSLEQFIGQPNTLLTHTAIEQVVENELTRDFLLAFPEISAVDVSPTQVLILVEFSSLERDDRLIQVQATLDLHLGEIFARSSYRTV